MGLDRIRITSVGYTGATGYTNMYFSSATGANLNAIRAMFDALKAYFPSTVTYQFPSSGDTIDETDGHLLGGWSAAAPASVTGTAVVSYAAPVGMLLEWRTAGVIDGHRPIGKTFLVPCSSSAQSVNGGVLGAAVSAANTAIATFLGASAGFSLWHRPVYNRATTPPTLVRPGGSFPIVSGACSPKIAVLRSRRD